MSGDQFRRETKGGNDEISIYRVFLQQIVHALGLEIIFHRTAAGASCQPARYCL